MTPVAAHFFQLELDAGRRPRRRQWRNRSASNSAMGLAAPGAEITGPVARHAETPGH